MCYTVERAKGQGKSESKEKASTDYPETTRKYEKKPNEPISFPAKSLKFAALLQQKEYFRLPGNEYLCLPFQNTPLLLKKLVVILAD